MIARLICALALAIAGIEAGAGLLAATAAESVDAARTPWRALFGFRSADLDAADLGRRLETLSPANAPSVVRDAAQALAGAPLAEAPLAVGGRALQLLGRTDDADKAFAALLRRSPRNPMARAWAIDHAFATGRPDEVMAHASALMALYPEGRESVLDWLTVLAANPAYRDAFISELRARPPWAVQFVRKLAAARPDHPLLFDLSRLTPDAQGDYLASLASAGRYEEAFLAWLDFLPSGETRFRWPYDSEFRQLPGAAPFNWRLDQANAEYIEGGGLDLVFLGRRTAVLAAQDMLLGPGIYGFSTEMSGEQRTRGGTFRWRLACHAGAPAPMELNIAPLDERVRAYEAEFVIPSEDCPVQRLALEGVAGELPFWAKARVVRVTMTPKTDPSLRNGL